MVETISDSTSVVRADRVGKRYGPVTVLDHVSLSASAGESVALIGHNGAGKTTFLKLLLGLTRASFGTVNVLGRDPLEGGPDLRRRLGYLPEHAAFHGAVTAREVLGLYAKLKGVAGSQVDELLERVGLSEVARRRIRTYSKGMRQRLGMAQALLGAPELLLLDEPTSGLDPVLRRDLYTVVESCRDAGATVLISTHALAEIEGRTDRIAVLSNGRLVAVGTLEELRRETGLPVAIRVTTVTGRAGALANDLHDAQLQKVNESSVSLSCSESEKLQIVARITSRPEWVRDVEIVRPGLEEIYACFVGDGRPR